MANGRQERERRERELDRFHKQQAREQAALDKEGLRRQREREREAARLEREEQAHYTSQREQEADALTKAAADQFDHLGSFLKRAVARQVEPNFGVRPVEFRPASFDVPVDLASPEPEPQWEPPQRSGWFSRFVSGDSPDIERQKQARMQYEQRLGDHRRREESRQARIEEARKLHAKSEQERKQRAETARRQEDSRRRAFEEGDADEVERTLKRTLEGRRLPEGVPAESGVAYRANSGQILVKRRLPQPSVVPTALRFRYVKKQDEITSTARKQNEVKERYAQLIAQVALLALHDVFAATSADVASEVIVACHLDTIDGGTGKPVDECLSTVSATRDEFEELVFADLNPVECMIRLNALMSSNPYDVQPVRPLFDPDLSRFRTVDAREVAAGLDSRTILTKLTPTEFEHLVRELFESMGMESWATQASRDDGVDGVAKNPHPVMGGLCVIQAKKYSKLVGADAVRALWGVMEDKKAATGILVTTSYFGKATHDFSARNERVRLIEGNNLKQLLQEHMGLDVLLGAAQPPKNQSWRNTA